MKYTHIKVFWITAWQVHFVDWTHCSTLGITPTLSEAMWCSPKLLALINKFYMGKDSTENTPQPRWTLNSEYRLTEQKYINVRKSGDTTPRPHRHWRDCTYCCRSDLNKNNSSFSMAGLTKCAHTHMNTHTHARTHACTHACTYACTHTHARTHACRHVHAHTHTCMHTRTHTHSCTHTHTHTHTHTRTCTCTHIHTYTHTHTPTQTHMHARTHEHTHTHF